MKTTIYLIRHSEKLKIQSQTDLERPKNELLWNQKIILSVNGEEKAKKLSKHPALQNLDALYSSNYVRAIATAKYIAAENNLNIIVKENLGERIIGNLTELEKRKHEYKDVYSNEQLLDIDLKMPGGESRRDVIARANKIIDEIANENEGKTVAVVAHACFFKHYFSSFCQMDNNFVFKFNNNIIPAADIIMPCIIKLEIEDGEKVSLELLK